MYWGESMNKFMRTLVFVLILGIVLPTIVLNILTRSDKYTIPKSSEEDPPAAVEYKVQVITEDGTMDEMDLEEYVLGVVLAEMPASFSSEALKAQAVLARTYALKRLAAMDKHQQGAICTDSTCCQGFCSPQSYAGDNSMLNKVKLAVKATESMILVYDGQLIEATYFSCSGGKTEDAVAVWGTEVPYLRATESPGEQDSIHYIDSVVMRKADVLESLGLSGNSLEISNITYTDGGGVDQICICGQTFTGVQIRELLQLKSTAFRMSVIGERVMITTKGFGHRVGMSQYGADAMAKAGKSYVEILSHYYHGTILKEIE